MMPDLHKRIVEALIAGAVLGWFLTAFVFYPPHAHWNDGLKLGDVATWFSALGTIAAVIVALAFGLRQMTREEAAAKELRSAIANALVVDLLTIRDLLRSNMLQWNASQTSMDDMTLKNWLRRVEWLTLPSFEAYREALPKLGPAAAPHVIEAYGIIIRVARIANGQSTTINSRDDNLNFAKIIVDKTPNVLLAIWRAYKVLKPFTRELSIPGEPTLEDLAKF